MSGSVEGSESDVNLTPLLDLVLQLIMFFMITVNFVRVDQINEDVVLPVAQSAVAMDKTTDEWIFLNMNREGKLVGSLEDINSPEKLKVHLQKEKDRLEREHRENNRKGEVKVVVVLRAHQDAKYVHVWEALNSCQKAGFTRWQMRVLTRAKPT